MFFRLVRKLAKFYYKKGKIRRIFVGPYSGIKYNITQELVGRSSIFYKGWEKYIPGLLVKLIKPDMVVYVCGAHVGIHVLHIAKLLKKTGIVHAFEPTPSTYSRLQENIELNRLNNGKVSIHKKAVGNYNGKSYLEYGESRGPDTDSHGMNKVVEASSSKSVEIEIVTLDKFSTEHKPPDLILVDVEGYELNLLEGSQSMIERHHPDMIVEFHSDELYSNCKSFLKRYGYKVEKIERHIVATHK